MAALRTVNNGEDRARVETRKALGGLLQMARVRTYECLDQVDSSDNGKN